MLGGWRVGVNGTSGASVRVRITNTESQFSSIVSSVFSYLQNHKRFFAVVTLIGFGLRWFFIRKFAMMPDDALVYGEMALNLLRHGILGMTGEQGPTPALFRLPGYPVFLAAVFGIFGAENYRAAMYVQMFVDVGTCFVVADLARRISGEGAARWAFAIAVLCPMTLNYVATALTETITMFFTVLAFNFYVMAREQEHDSPAASSWGTRREQWLWVACGGATAGCIIFRPDGGMVLIAIGLVMIWLLIRTPGRRRIFLAGVLVLGTALAPLVPWTIRNWRVFHVIQPLPPVSASNPGEVVLRGFTRWSMTWVVDYSSTEDLLFNVPGEPADINVVPDRAFDSREERARTKQLFDQYKADGNRLGAELDEEFGTLAQERTARHPIRTHVGLPLVRMLDMWFRPRTELLPLDIHWWNIKSEFVGSLDGSLKEILPAMISVGATVGLGVLNIALVVIGFAGLFVRKRMRYIAPIVVYMVVRTAFLTAANTIEPRYTIECLPMLMAFAAHFMVNAGRETKDATEAAPA